MSFLNPLYLVAAVAALIPILIHLLHRQRVRTEDFPSLEFLRKMLRRKSKRLRIRQLILLILRTLLILLIAIALARPTLMGKQRGGGHLPTTAVIIIDDSYSMARNDDGVTLFEVAKTKVSEIVSTLNDEDEVFLLTCSAPYHTLTESPTSDFARIRSVIDELTWTYHPTDISPPLEKALLVCKSSSKPAKEIYIVSDMQESAWRGFEAKLEGGDFDKDDLKVLLVDIGDELPNHSVRNLSFRIPRGGNELRLHVEFAAYNAQEKQGRLAEVYYRDLLLDRAVVSGASHVTKTFTIPLPRGMVWGEVRLASDALDVDNVRYFAVSAAQRLIGVVGKTFYIETALSPEGASLFKPLVIEEGMLTPSVLSGVDVLILSDLPRLTSLEVEAISEFIEAGGGIIIFLGSDVDIGAYNTRILPLFGDCKIVSVRTASGGYFSLDSYMKGHPIFERFKADKNPFSEIRFKTFMEVTCPADKVLATYTDGKPAVVEIDEQAILFTSSCDTTWTDFPLTPQFLPLIYETIFFLTSKGGIGSDYQVGEEILIRSRKITGEVMLSGPTGSRYVYPELMGKARGYRIEPPEEPGVYFVTSDTDTLSVFAVNVSSSESDLTKIDFGKVRDALKGITVKIAHEEDDLRESISMMRVGKEMSHTILWIVFALILAETVIASNVFSTLRRTRTVDVIEHS